MVYRSMHNPFSGVGLRSVPRAVPEPPAAALPVAIRPEGPAAFQRSTKWLHHNASRPEDVLPVPRRTHFPKKKEKLSSHVIVSGAV